MGVQSFWSDEGFTAKIAAAHLGSAISQIPHSESTPPLYYSVAWVWAHLFGSSEFVLRLPSAIFGCLTVWAVYWAGVALVARRVALIAAALTAVSPIMVWYSQEARAYALLVLLCVLALGFFLRLLRNHRTSWMIGWAVCSTAALATHYFAFFPFVAEGTWLLLRARERRQVLLMLLGPLAMCGALAPLALHQERIPRWWSSAIAVSDQWKAIVQSFLVGITWTPLTHRAGVLALGALAVAAAVALARRGTAEERQTGLALAALATVTLALPTLVSLFGNDYLAPRNVLYAWPVLALIVALGAGRRNAGPLSAAGLAAGLGLSLAIVIAVPFVTGLQREDWRDVLRPLGTATSQRVLVATDGSIDTPVITHYVPNVRTTRLPTRVGEVDVISDARQREAAAAQVLRGDGMRVVSQDARGGLTVTRFTAPRPVPISGTTAPGSDESILVQEPATHP